ncbi:MAG: sulfotransferase, partial [Verrucomicrobiae bacterium]|nr:sulfotransferase [Verrucomicrobiae bacterium]
IRNPTPQANHATAKELTEEERARVREMAGPYLDSFDYRKYL